MPVYRLTRPLAAALLLFAVASTGGCNVATGDDATLTGNVVSDALDISLPALPTPVPDIQAPLEQAGSSQQRSQQVTVSPVVQATSLGQAFRIAGVRVRAGEAVRAGDELMTLDRDALLAGIAQAEAAWRRARSQARLLEERVDDVASAREDLAAQRAELEDMISELEETRAGLVAQLAEARAVAARLRSMATSRPPAVPSVPSQPRPSPQAPSGLEQLQRLQTGIARLEGAIARIDQGLKTARTGLQRIDTARADLSDARRQLERGAELSRISADAARTGVDLAEAYAEMAVLRSPVDGTVIEVTQVGTVLSPGATVARVRPSQAGRIGTWAQTERVTSLEIGDEAEVRVDSLPGEVFAGRVSFIGEEAAFPPTSLATREIHMLRAVRLEVTLEESATLPAGTPADIIVTTR